ncbi:TonB-dependent siderophore receptor [Negadavirga shengliensis]|uniref:TonB-dependent siderophore receptor n=1 Tax=Negadavirga shengliensis TaxID=1389218 RepID=A0ABV9T6Z8_9BACT
MRNYLYILFFPMLLSLSSYAQNGGIEGYVLTADGKAAEFVNVSINGLSVGAATDNNGYYLIDGLQPGIYTLSTSYVGFEREEKKVKVEEGRVVAVNMILKESLTDLHEIMVSGNQNRFYLDSSFTVSKLPLKDMENPQVYQSVSRQLMKEQVVTGFNDALKNATGVARLWESTGRGGDGAEYFSMRGFAVQPTMINGMPGLNNGGLDPANIESIDVIKGPSGTLFGSPLISYGGLINITTKKPYDSFGGEVAYITGSFGLNRITADVNTPLGENTFARINTAYHSQNSFQDAGQRRSFFIAPSLTIKANDRLTFLINTEFLEIESVNAPMIFLNRDTPLSFKGMQVFENHYERSFTSNELGIRNPTFGIQAQALYKISDTWTSQTVLSRSSAQTKGYYHYLWDFGNGNTFGRYISKRNGETHTTDIQQNFIGDFRIGGFRNRMVVGLDYYRSNIFNGSTGWVLNGEVTLADGGDTGALTQAGVDRLLAESFEGNSNGQNEVMSAYLSDVINLSSSLAVMASVRIDNFKGKTAYWVEEEVSNQTAVSPKLGMVYQVLPGKVSLFGNYMNGFMNVAPAQVADADGSNPRLQTFDPENANQLEFGIKTHLYKDRISATLSYYDILVRNRVMTDPNNINSSIQGGEVESKGLEFSLVANPVSGLNLIAGFSKNKSEVLKDNPGDGYVGLRPEEAGPETLLNFWASYTFQAGALEGFGIGAGGNTASEHKTLNRANIGTFTLPGYEVFNAMISYTGQQYVLALKANNITNQEYYSGWSTITPQPLRNVSLALNYRF